MEPRLYSDTVANEIVPALRTRPICKRKATDTACECLSRVIRILLSCHKQARKSKYERQKTVCGVCLLRLSHTAYYKKGVFEENVSSLWTENRTETMLLLLILFHLDFFMRFIHFFRAFLYLFFMHFHTLQKCVFIIN